MDTVRYFPTVINFPKVSLTDHLRQARSDIISVLTNSPSQISLDLELGDRVQNAILKLAIILNTADIIPVIEQLEIKKSVPLPRVKESSPPPTLIKSTHPHKNIQPTAPSLSRVNKLQIDHHLLDKLPNIIGRNKIVVQITTTYAPNSFLVILKQELHNFFFPNTYFLPLQ